jgi:site-specific DNA-cytosine methylase
MGYPAPLRLIEFFAGLGGWRRAFGPRAQVAAAYDISPHALAAYALIHGEAPLARELATLPAEELLRHGADTWVMSPPCQPFCRMGNRLDLQDPRSRAFLRLMDLFREAPPAHFVLESVEGFLGSGAHGLLRERLEEAGFQAQEYTLCPTRFGLPNLRPRAYVVASREPLRPPPLPGLEPGPLEPYLDPVEDPALYLPEAVLARHKPGLDLVTPQSRRTACFIGGYGRRYVGGGSYLVTDRGIRRFSVAEVGRLLGWPGDLPWNPDTGAEARYKLLGNGLSLPVARWIADHL